MPDSLFHGLRDDELVKLARKFVQLGETALDERSVKAPPLTEFSTGDDETRFRDLPKQRAEYRKLGEFLQEVAIAETPGNQIPERLLRATGLSEGVASEGGFLLDTDLSNDLLKATFETGKLARYCKHFKISSNSNSIELNCFDETSRANGYRLGGIRVYTTAESGLKEKSKPKFRQLKLVLKKITGLCYSSDELLADVELLGQVLSDGFSNEMSFKIDDLVLNGSGAGEMLGILNSSALIAVTPEVGQASATIQVENILKMYSRQISPSTSIWLINKNVTPQLYTMGIVIGTGGAPIFMPAGSIAGIPYNTLLGRPVIEVEQAQSLGTKGDIYFVDLSQYIIADKGGIQSASSVHLRFDYDETVFRWVYRCDGQPVLASGVTPFKGSDTVSYYVTLDDR
jgi:HK97 family phage major capsid protein